MYVGRLFLISALLVANVRCDCDKYIECFGDFLRDFFTNFGETDENVNCTDDSGKSKAIELINHEVGNIENVLSEITSFIENIDLNIKQTDVSNHENNNTKIIVKSFELEKDFSEEYVTEAPTTTTETATAETTTEINIIDEISNNEVTTPTGSTTTEKYMNVIPLKSVKDNEITDPIYGDYKDDEENFTDYPNIDYLAIYKDTTLKPVTYIPTEPPTTEYSELRAEIDKQENEIENIIENSISVLNHEALNNIIVNVTKNNLGQKHKSTLESSLFPWVAAIFVKNESKGSQFDYFCDGAILTETAILTAARCVQNRNETYNEEDFIVILGKTSLQVSGNHEKILRVKSVKLHDNFTITNGIATNDLAVIILEEPVSFDEGIAPAHLVEEDQPKETEEESTKALTTAWSFGGDLTVIYLDKGTANACGTDAKVENTLCATYGLDVPLCPSYGGLYVKKQANKLYLNGIRTGNPLERGICFSKAVSYTSLQSYFKWIREIVENKLA